MDLNKLIFKCVHKTAIYFIIITFYCRYAAGLLTDVQVDGLYPKSTEADFFNKSCASVGLTFTFTASTKLVVLESVRQHSGGLQILELPKSDPFSQAHYVTDEKDESGAVSICQYPLEGYPDESRKHGYPQWIRDTGQPKCNANRKINHLTDAQFFNETFK